MNDSFSALHPALTFCYFAAVLLLTMLVLHPVFLALSLLGALGYCAVLRGWRSLGRTLGWLVPFLVLMAALNALLNLFFVIVLKMNVNGVAIATVLSNAVSSVLLLRRLLREPLLLPLLPRIRRIFLQLLLRVRSIREQTFR